MPELTNSKALLCLSPRVPPVQMSHPMSPLSCSGTAIHIQDLRHCMDIIGDGFSQSDSEDSLFETEELMQQDYTRAKATHINHIPSKKFIRDHHKESDLIVDNHRHFSDSKPVVISRQTSREERASNLKTSSTSISIKDSHQHIFAKTLEDHHTRSNRIAQTLAFKNHLDTGNDRNCQFGKVKTEEVHKELCFTKEKPSSRKETCICDCLQTCDDALSGWGVTYKPQKTKSAKRSRKSFSKTSSETAFNRLIGVTERDEFEFEHYPESHRYIEQYRFQHTVGDVCRRAFDVKPPIVRRNVDTDPYYSKIRNTICAIASNCDILAILAGEKDNQSITSSETSNNNRSRSDEEAEDPKTLSMRDRGKTLNLAPVRECMVPTFTGSETKEELKQTYLTLNQYLNLVIPPKSGLGNTCLQSDNEETRDRRYRVANPGDTYLYSASTPRKAPPRALRLGSAEFVKPGTQEQFGPPETRWSNSADKKNGVTIERKLQKSTSFHTSTVPGNLYVGSTVTRDTFSPAVNPRATSGGQQLKKPLTPNPTPIHSISGKKCKPNERVGDLGMSRSRGSAREDAHAHAPSSAPLPFRSHMASELRESHVRRKEKILSVNVAHLGVRGRTFKPDEHLTILYKFNKDKSRRIAINSSLKS